MTPEFIQDKIDELESLLVLIEDECNITRVNGCFTPATIELDKGISRLNDLINILGGYMCHLEEERIK